MSLEGCFEPRFGTCRTKNLVRVEPNQIFFLLHFMDHEGIFEEITDNELPSQIDNFHFLENQLRAVLPMRILQLLHNYFRKCLEHNPHIRFDGGLENSVAVTIFLYWLISGSSFRRIGNRIIFSGYWFVYTRS